MNESEIESRLRSRILEMMGGDPGGPIDTDRILHDGLCGLQEREWMCGAYWMLSVLYPNHELLREAAVAKTKEEMEKIAIAMRNSLWQSDRGIE